ncbi:type II toxin-antitoxin system PemK/MazF family toxin [Microbacterium sp. STN6]|uniref:type II toxin-antitoxin system PemK/MazF family toxin n=1 Tax=Microbacterium sp. STN6 TaxID=2995588 RepID=UPI002260BD4B|nr:type II toxin-antitoxin system PemK/MazF family toxin [Microbacterium sp. STN6]MCX7521550.1 type II toxin-antitoxin system PemK/MazF family toxin [Microbacterium sp. STN6]
MNRGEIWTVAGGAYASRPRPAVVLQDDLFASTGSVTIALFTSSPIDAPITRIRVESTDISGLENDCDIMADKLTTVRRADVRDRVGRLTPEQLIDLERAVMVFLGLAR